MKRIFQSACIPTFKSCKNCPELRMWVLFIFLNCYKRDNVIVIFLVLEDCDPISLNKYKHRDDHLGWILIQRVNSWDLGYCTICPIKGEKKFTFLGFLLFFP